MGLVVSRAIGLDCLSHSADYIQLYRGDSDTLRESMYFIRNTAADLIEALYRTAYRPPAMIHSGATPPEHQSTRRI